MGVGLLSEVQLVAKRFPSAVSNSGTFVGFALVLCLNATTLPAGFGPHMFHAMGPPPPFMRAPGPIHYPSQDPQRMGAHAGKHSSP